MPYILNLAEVTVGEIETAFELVPEEKFFADRAIGQLKRDTLPQPDGVVAWNRAMFQGHLIHVARTANLLYVLADTVQFGFCLFKMEAKSNDTIFKVAALGGNRIIASERKEHLSMNATSVLAGMGGMSFPTAPEAVNRIPLGGQQPVTEPVQGAGASPVQEGISSSQTDISSGIKKLARAFGYVAGYIMGNAPSVAMRVSYIKGDNGEKTPTLGAVQSKPSNCRRVLLTLPKACCMQNGTLVPPDLIVNGSVDYDPNNRETINLALEYPAAVGYISVVGGLLPEYAPHVTNVSKHWAPSDIISNRDEVTFVEARPGTRRKTVDTSTAKTVRWVLRTTSPRRTLYTPKNIICLRALEHAPVACETEADVYRVNEMAFGRMRYQPMRDKNGMVLPHLFNNCPSQIWKKKYTVDGKEVDGIGSVFFMAGNEEKTQNGEVVHRVDPTYWPWYTNSKVKGAAPATVTELVKRTFQPATDKRKVGMVTSPVTYASNPGSPLFQDYTDMINFATKNGYLTKAELVGLCSRAASARNKKRGIQKEERESMLSMLSSEAVVNAVQRARDSVLDRSILANAGGR